MAITKSQIEKAVNNQIMIDGSSIEGFVRIQESDQYLYPDLSSFQVLPWRPQYGKVARFICDVHNPDGTPFVGDPRGVLQRVLKKAADMDILLMLDRSASSSSSKRTARENPRRRQMTRPDILTLVL